MMKIMRRRQYFLFMSKRKKFSKKYSPIYVNRMNCEMYGVWNMKYFDRDDMRRRLMRVYR